MLDLPLFPGYVFVKLDLRERLKVLQLRGVVGLVGFGGQPSPLPDEEIGMLRKGLSSRSAIPHHYMDVGQRVRIERGPLQGLEGILVARKNRLRLVVSVQLIMRSVAVEVNDADLWRSTDGVLMSP